MLKYKNPSIADLAVQLKRGPKRLRLRQLYSIEFVLSVAGIEKRLPFDFVVHALTGFRSPGGKERSNGSDELIGVDVLRTDLVMLAEELSADADISLAAWPEHPLTVAELAERFDVSTKTIFRWHKRGLVGWRFRFQDRRLRLAFPEKSIRRFVTNNTDLVQRGSSFSQLSEEERTIMIDRARALVDAGERTVNAVAKLIAAETGRAVETIRLVLKSYDEAHPRAGVFNRSKLDVDADDDRLRIWEAYCDGASIEVLARRFERGNAEVYAVITEMRARNVKADPIEYVPSEEFAAPDAEETILNDLAARDPYDYERAKRRVPSDLPPYLQQLYRIPLLSAEGEAASFRRYNYLKFKADRAREALDPTTATAGELDRIEALLTDADEVKNKITQSNLRLVVSIAKRHATPTRDFFEIVSDGNISLMRAVEKFDYSRGFKFSTYASWAIIKNYARTVPDHKIHRDRYQTGRDELLDSLSMTSPEEHENEFLPAVRTTLDRMLETLDDRERTILQQHYGLDGRGEPSTLEQIGQQFGVSKERVRQLEARAMAKLREAFGPEVLNLLGA